MSPSPEKNGHPRGYVIPIGGAEERTGAQRVLKRFVKLCGGRKARIAIIPTASNLPDAGDKYIEIFNKIGVSHAVSLPINERAETDRQDYLDQLDQADGIFITGGNQLRLSTLLVISGNTFSIGNSISIIAFRLSASAEQCAKSNFSSSPCASKLGRQPPPSELMVNFC